MKEIMIIQTYTAILYFNLLCTAQFL